MARTQPAARQQSQPQGRVARMPRDQRRAQLLDAANQVFTSKGYHAAAMDDIAELAGVSKPVLYQHFPSKLDLYLALLETSCDRLIEVVEDALDSTEDNAARVVATMGAFYDFVNSASGEFRFVFESDLTGDGQVQKRLWEVNNQIADAIAEVIVEDTDLSPDRAKLLAISLVGVAQVSARYWVSGGTKKSIALEEAKQLVSTLAWRGIGGFPLHEHALPGHNPPGHNPAGHSLPESDLPDYELPDREVPELRTRTASS
ncbi:TetR/AcrR family transcriptional regulator [Microlunatus ginsengisoli]|uniref:TetR/AcrR family transcriptional regulator n=1 Tax=Microlunatus ginsengisoli TaxID=363863 RepID=A0ABP6ZXZ2_9ACTN